MPIYFGPFNKFWSHEVPLHLHIMNLRPSTDGEGSFSDQAVDLLRSIIREGNAEEIKTEITNMINDQNWRANLVGAFCIFLIDENDQYEFLELIWKKLDERSWAAPQLVAVAAVLDSNFKDKAKARLRRNEMSPVPFPDEKYLGALFQLLIMKYGDHGFISPHDQQGEVDMGKAIAKKWTKALFHCFPQHKFQS
jgi:hypothetical protein